MRGRLVACRPCFETLASLAPQHEVVVFQQVRPHPEEAANRSRECAPDDRLRGRLEGMARITVSRQGYCHADLMNFRQRRAPFRFNRNGKGSSPVYGEQRRRALSYPSESINHLSRGIDWLLFMRVNTSRRAAPRSDEG